VTGPGRRGELHAEEEVQPALDRPLDERGAAVGGQRREGQHHLGAAPGAGVAVVRPAREVRPALEGVVAQRRVLLLFGRHPLAGHAARHPLKGGADARVIITHVQQRAQQVALQAVNGRAWRCRGGRRELPAGV